jgi:hypothetical protein
LDNGLPSFSKADETRNKGLKLKKLGIYKGAMVFEPYNQHKININKTKVHG